MRENDILGSMLILVILFQLGLYIEKGQACKTCMMFNTTKDLDYGVSGYYYIDDVGNEYYKVWLAGQSFQRINTTDYHEACHALVCKDYNEFCELDNMTMKLCLNHS